MKNFNKKIFKIDSGFYLIVLLSLLNFAFFFDSNLVLFFTLFFLFVFLSIFLVNSIKIFIENEKIQQQLSVLDFLNRTKNNFVFLKHINNRLITLFTLFYTISKLKYFNSIFYRCLIIPKKNYFFNFIFSFIFFSRNLQKNSPAIFYTENFFDF